MEFFLIRGIGSEVTGTAGATAKLDFTGASGYAANFKRQAIVVASCGAATVYIKLIGRSAAAPPTVSAATFHFAVPAGSSAVIQCTRDVDAYLFGTTAFTAVELGY